MPLDSGVDETWFLLGGCPGLSFLDIDSGNPPVREAE